LPLPAQQYIKGLRAEAANNRKALTAEQLAAREREQSRLAEQGKWQELAESRAKDLNEALPYKERVQDLEAMIREGNEARIKAVPENMRALIPMDYPPERLARWLDANAALLIPRNAPDLDAGASGGGSGKPITLTSDQVAMARQMGMTPEAYAAQLQAIDARKNSAT
jgi:hypothetical protein